MARAALALRLARRELRGGLRGFVVFLVCLALGVGAIAAVGSVRAAIDAGLRENGAVILGGDAEITLTYRFATAAERRWMEETARAVSEIVDFRSMAVAGDGDGAIRALARVKAVDDAYPLYGAVRLAPARPLAEALAGRGAVMAPILADRLGLSPGDSFRLGEKSFRLTAILERMPDDTGQALLGPPILLRRAALEGSGLLVPGTLFESRYRMALPGGADPDALESQVKARFADSGLRWRDARRAAPGTQEFIDRISAFLVLVGLAGLAVGGVGIAASVRAYLEGKIETMAVLRTLGAGAGLVFAVYLAQIGALAALGVAIGLALGAGVPFALAPVLLARLPVPAEIGLYPGPLAEAALYGGLTALVFTLWPLSRTRRVKPAALFREGAAPARAWPGAGIALVLLALAAALVGAAAILSGVPRLALWAAAGIAAALLLLFGAARLLARLSRFAARRLRRRPALRLALGAVGAPGGETGAVVLALGLGLSVLAAVGQIDVNLRAALARDLPEVAPAYFVVDIQPDQIAPFREMLRAERAVTKTEAAPMLRGIITAINGRDPQEVAGDHWVLRGDRGVTYSERPPARTRITAGAWWPEGYSGPPQVSFAAGEAAELGLALGDRLTVNILGRDIEARITSFREVDFSTAGIGFVMAMNPAALKGAPHSWIATVYADEGAGGALVNRLAREFPNITVIGVRAAIERISEIIAGLAAAITYGALATLVTGLFVLIGAAAAGARARTREAAILKTLGAGRGRILASFAMRSALMGAAAGIVAVAAGAGGGWAVMRFVMEAAYDFAAVPALAIVAGGVAVTLLAGLGFALGPLAARPAAVLRARE